MLGYGNTVFICRFNEPVMLCWSHSCAPFNLLVMSKIYSTLTHMIGVGWVGLEIKELGRISIMSR